MIDKKLQNSIIFLFHGLLITVPFFFTWINEELFEFPKMLLAYGFAVLITGLWILRMIVSNKIILKSTIFDWPLLAFLISQTLSTILSIHPRTSIFGYYTRFHGGLLSTITYLLLFYAFVSNIPLIKLKSFYLTILLAATGVIFYAIPEHFGHSLSCTLIANQFNTSCWVQDVKSRVFATFGQPNWLAAYLITILPLATMLIIELKNKFKKILFGIINFGLFLTLLYTKSRSGFVGFGISFITFGFGYFLINKTQPLNFKKIRSIIIFAVIFLTTSFFIGTPFSASFDQLLTINNQTASVLPTNADQQNSSDQSDSDSPIIDRLQQGGTDSGEIRKIVWTGAIDIWKRYPLFGSGVETFAYSYYQDRPLAHNLVSEWDFLYNKAHNEFLNFLATTGIFGLIAYLSILGWFSYFCLTVIIFNKFSLPIKSKHYLNALFAGIIALSISNFFGFSTVMVSILLFMFLAFTALTINPDNLLVKKITKNLQSKKIHQNDRLKLRQYLFLTATVFAIITLEINIIKIWQADKAFAVGKSYFANGQYAQSIANLQLAANISPAEALYHNELADTYSKLATALANEKDSTQAAQLSQAALNEVDVTLRLNPRHINFHKTKARVLITLAQIEPKLLNVALESLQTALQLAPTDAKLMYNLGIVQISLGQTTTGIDTLEKTLVAKPNYEAARVALANQYLLQNQPTQALFEYQYIYDHITKQNQVVNDKIKELTPTNQ